MQISGHKNVNSLNNYSKFNPEQSENISDILTAQSVNAPPASFCIIPQNAQPNAQVQNAKPMNAAYSYPLQNSFMPMKLSVVAHVMAQ